MKILLVAEEAGNAAYLRKGLTENGFVVDVAGQGEDGFHRARTHSYDAIILDHGLAQRNGWSSLADPRDQGQRAPILFLTEPDDPIAGGLGADDFLESPFAFSELVARLRGLLRRGPLRQLETVLVADLQIDLVRLKVNRAGQRLGLTPKEFVLLSLLARRAGEVLTRSVIAEQAWDMHFRTATNVVDVHVRRLRTKVDDPFERKLIHTVRGVGYVLEERC